MQTNILEYLEQTVRRLPDKTAFSLEDGSMTFLEVYDGACAIGSRLLRDGHYKKPVVVFMKKSPETITAFLGVLYSGCFYVPLDDEMPRYRIELILKELRPAACICDEATLNTARGLDNTGTVYVYGDIAVGEIDMRA